MTRARLNAEGWVTITDGDIPQSVEGTLADGQSTGISKGNIVTINSFVFDNDSETAGDDIKLSVRSSNITATRTVKAGETFPISNGIVTGLSIANQSGSVNPIPYRIFMMGND